MAAMQSDKQQPAAQMSPPAGFYHGWDNPLPRAGETLRHLARVALDFVGAQFATRNYDPPFCEPTPPAYGCYSGILAFGDQNVMQVALGKMPSGPDAYTPSRNFIPATYPQTPKQAG